MRVVSRGAAEKIAVGLVALSVLGCSSSSGASTSGTTDTTPDLKWGCVGNVSPLPSGTTTTATLQLVDAVSMAPLGSGIVVKLCAKTDSTCSTPLATPVIDATGTVSVTVASDFDGYLDITDPADTYPPTLVFIDLVAGAKNGTSLVLSRSARAALAATVGVAVDPSAGLLVLTAVDCTGAPSGGVGVSVAPASGTVFYELAASPSSTTTQTDASGVAGVVNASAGAVTVTGSLDAGGKKMGEVSTLTRAGSTTMQFLRPTPML